LEEPPGERADIGISHWAYKISNSKNVWMAIRKGSGLVHDERTDLSRGAKDNVIATDVWRTGDQTTNILNVYDHKDTQ
jgi:hypothetical protein